MREATESEFFLRVCSKDGNLLNCFHKHCTALPRKLDRIICSPFLLPLGMPGENERGTGQVVAQRPQLLERPRSPVVTALRTVVSIHYTFAPNHKCYHHSMRKVVWRPTSYSEKFDQHDPMAACQESSNATVSPKHQGIAISQPAPNDLEKDQQSQHGKSVFVPPD